MTEHMAAAETIAEPVAERNTRQHAISALAADMLFMYGQTDDHSRSIAWADGGQTFCLTRGDHTQWLSEQEGNQANWLHVLGADGEHATYSLAAGSPNGLTDPMQRETIASALCAEATRQMFEAVRVRFAAQKDRVFTVYHDQIPATFEDFTDAPYESFIWIKVGSRGTYTAYDFTPNELRRPDAYGTQPVPAAASQEELLRWVMHALTRDTVDPSRLPTQRKYEYRPVQPKPAEASPEDVGDFLGTDIRYFMDELETWSHDALYLKTKEGVTVARTIVPMYEYDHANHTLVTTPTAIGLVYDHNSVFMETFELASAGKTRKVIKVDIAQRKAYGSSIVDGRGGEGYRGNVAADELHHYLIALGEAYDNDEIEQCAPDIAALFQYKALRPPEDSVQ